MNPVIIYENLVLSSTLTAGNTASGYNVDYLKDERTFNLWKGVGTSNTLKIDLGSEKFIGAIAFVGHNLLNATIKISKSADGITYSQLGSTYRISTTGTALKFLTTTPGGSGLQGLDGGELLGLDGGQLLPLGVSSYTSRYWKIEITSAAAPQISNLVMGDFILFEYPPEVPTVPFTEKIISNSETSNESHLLGVDIRYHQKDVSLNFKNLDRNWFATKIKPFWNDHAKLQKPFILSWDFDYRPDEVFYCALPDSADHKEPLSIGPYVDELQINAKVLA